MAYWTQTDLEDKVGEEVVRQVLDDANSGSPSPGALLRLQADSDSYVEGALIGIYDITVVRATPPNRVKQLSLDAAEMLLAKRNKSYVKRDWEKLKAALDNDLLMIRKGIFRLDTPMPPEPNAIQGGSIGTSEDPVIAPCPVFLGGMGDY